MSGKKNQESALMKMMEALGKEMKGIRSDFRRELSINHQRLEKLDENASMSNQKFLEKDIVVVGFPEGFDCEAAVRGFCAKFGLAEVQINDFFKFGKKDKDGELIFELFNPKKFSFIFFCL
jgi:hypothetical protein